VFVCAQISISEETTGPHFVLFQIVTPEEGLQCFYDFVSAQSHLESQKCSVFDFFGFFGVNHNENRLLRTHAA